MKKLLSTLVIALLILSMVFVPFLASAEGATIWTDKDNYGPSETVTIFGSGFLPSTEVTITLEAPDLSVATIYAWTDEFGAFTAQYVLDGMEGTYTITATDGTNTATTTFTEAPKVAATWADGDCEDIKVTASGLASGKNYYMTYTDPGSVVQRTTPTFPGPSAYTEYFVLDITLPTILGTWTMKLYETPSTLKDTDTVDIGMMVWTTDSTYATMKTSFAQGETLYIKAIGLLASKYYNFRLDPPTGSSIYVFSSYQGGVTQLTGSYVLPLTAKTGEWKLHVRKADNAAGTSHEGHYVDRYFTVTPYTAPPTYSVTFDAVATSPLPDVDGTTVIVTGTIGVTSFTVTNAELPKTFAGITSGTTITYTYTDPVPSTVLDKRYRLLSVTGPSSGFSLTTDTTITGNYKAQYYLTVSSDHGTTSGEDWYDECTYAYAGLDIGMVEEDGTRYLFVEWTGDASGTGLTSDAIHMDGPKTAIAEWKTQYYLTVVSPYDTPGGMGWYDKDATAYATLVSGIVDLAPGQRAVFTGWTGDASGTGLTSDAITMSGPKTATALWVIQWYLDVDVAPPEAGTVPGEDWYNHCTTVTLTAPEYLPSEAGTSGVRYKFSSWDVDGTPVTGNPIDVHMDAPHIATAHYTVQYYLTVKTDPEGIATIPGEGWYDACTWKTLTAPLEPDVKYLFAYWDVDSFFDVFLENVIKVHMDAPHTATAHYKDYLGHAREEIEDLRAYLNALRAAGKIGKREYDYFMHALNAIEKDITRGMKQLDRERHGFNDRQKGFEDLRHAVMKIKRLIHQVENWVKKGKIPAGDAAWIISELETIRMKLVNKAWAEALAEKVLALKAIAAAKALGKDTTKAEAELIKINRELAKAIQKIAEGKYSQAIQHFKHAFNHSQHAVKKAYDPSWSIDYKDWIDELEEEDP